jgi:hypothetical protein
MTGRHAAITTTVRSIPGAPKLSKNRQIPEGNCLVELSSDNELSALQGVRFSFFWEVLFLAPPQLRLCRYISVHSPNVKRTCNPYFENLKSPESGTPAKSLANAERLHSRPGNRKMPRWGGAASHVHTLVVIGTMR